MSIIQKLVESTAEKKKPRFDFSSNKRLDQNEDVVMMISTENLRLRDKQLEHEIIKKIEFRMEQTFHEYPKKFIEDGMWRRFSKYVGLSHQNRKTGVDLYLVATAIQIAMLLVIFLFYKQMEEPIYGSTDALNSLKGERFSGNMTIFLFIQVGFIVFERYLFLMNPKEWTDWETFKKTKTEYGDPRLLLIKRITRGIDKKSPKEKLICVMRRVRILISLFNIDGKKFRELIDESHKLNELDGTEEQQKVNDYIHNPLFKRLKFIKFLMAVFYLAMFLYFPLRGNYKLSNTSPKIFCNSFFQIDEGSASKISPKCNHVNENIYIHIFFIFTTLYFILCALQIKNGESFLKNQKKKNRKWTTGEKLTNTLVTKVPFVFEIKTALDFAVTKTSLGLFDWFKFEDIFNTFFEAKYAQISNDMKRLGTIRAQVEKFIFGWAALVIFLAIVLAPIFIFSNFNPDSVLNTVQSFETTVGIKMGYSKFVLYSNSNPKVIRDLSQREFESIVSPKTNKLTYQQGGIQMIKLYPFGDSDWAITKDMYNELEKLLLATLNKQDSAKMYLTFRMSQLNSKSTLYTVESPITPQVVLLMHELLNKCSNNRISIAGFYNQLLKVNPTSGVEVFVLDKENEGWFNKTVDLKASCTDSSNSTKTGGQVQYWNVTDEVQGSAKSDASDNGITFYIVLDTFSKNLSMFSSVSAPHAGRRHVHRLRADHRQHHPRRVHRTDQQDLGDRRPQSRADHQDLRRRDRSAHRRRQPARRDPLLGAHRHHALPRDDQADHAQLPGAQEEDREGPRAEPRPQLDLTKLRLIVIYAAPRRRPLRQRARRDDRLLPGALPPLLLRPLLLPHEVGRAHQDLQRRRRAREAALLPLVLPLDHPALPLPHSHLRVHRLRRGSRC